MRQWTHSWRPGVLALGRSLAGAAANRPTFRALALLLAGLVLSLMAYAVVQATPVTAVLHEEPDAPSTVAMLMFAPIEPERSALPDDLMDAERDVAASGALSAALGSTNQGSSPLYDLAAAHYGLDPWVPGALHEVESTTSFSGCMANRQGSGALGPFQFMPATFRAYAVDADGNGQTDICGFADSLFSAARYIQALGADARPDSDRTYRALLRYGTHAARVVALAARSPE